MAKFFESMEDRHERERRSFFEDLKNVDRRTFLKLSAAAMELAATKGVAPHSFQLIEVAGAAPIKAMAGEPAVPGSAPFSFAYISDTHFYERKLNERFVRAILGAVDDVNNLNPQPDFVLFGGDLAQLGKVGELKLGAEIPKAVKAPVCVMVGEHDWFLDMGEYWRETFGPQSYSFDHKVDHFVVINSILEKEFWTPLNLTPMQRMEIVAGLDDGRQGRFEVGEEQRNWMKRDLEKAYSKTPVIVFFHSPLYKYFRN